MATTTNKIATRAGALKKVSGVFLLLLVLAIGLLIFVRPTTVSDPGNSPYGYDTGQIPGFAVTDLNAYWTSVLSGGISMIFGILNSPKFDVVIFAPSNSTSSVNA